MRSIQASQNATIATSNLSQDAAKLSSTLQQDLNPAMANAAFNALGGQKAFNAFATALVNSGPGSQATIQAGQKVAQELLSIDKNAGQAKSQFVGWAESMGLSGAAANKLWGQVSAGVKPLDSVRDGLAKGATAGGDLAKSGFWGTVKDKIVGLGSTAKNHPVAAWFGGFFNMIPGVTGALDKIGGVSHRILYQNNPQCRRKEGKHLRTLGSDTMRQLGILQSVAFMHLRIFGCHLS